MTGEGRLAFRRRRLLTLVRPAAPTPVLARSRAYWHGPRPARPVIPPGLARRDAGEHGGGTLVTGRPQAPRCERVGCSSKSLRRSPLADRAIAARRTTAETAVAAWNQHVTGRQLLGVNPDPRPGPHGRA